MGEKKYRYPAEDPDWRKRMQEKRALRHRKTVHAVEIDLPSYDGREKPKERHARAEAGIRRVEASTERVFDFLDGLVMAGSAVLHEYEQGHTLDAQDLTILSEARNVALKFMDKTVPDLIAGKEASQSPVHITISGPINRLQEAVPTTAKKLPTPEIEAAEPEALNGHREATSGNGTH